MRLFDRRVQITCAQCGKEFSTQKSKAGKGAKYCSSECFEESRQRRVQCFCEVCGKGFELRPADISEGKGRYCSWECYNRSRTKRVVLKCLECGNEFEAIPADLRIGKGKYCSQTCANQATGRERARKAEYFVCAQCGKTFQAKQTPAQAARGERQYCSQNCFAQARQNRIEKSCEQCGKKIYLTPAAIELGQGHFCSKACADKGHQRRVPFKCLICGTEFELERSRVAEGRGRFCSKRCSLRYRGETSIEQLMREELEQHNERFEPQVQFQRYHVDFVLPRRMAVIECDGEYWHSKLDVFARDRRKDEYLKNLGYKVFRFSDRDIRNSPKDCLNQVLAMAPVITMVK